MRRKSWMAAGVAAVLAWGVLAHGQAVAKTVLSLFRIDAIDAPLDIIGGVQTEPVRTGRLEAIDGGYVSVPRLDAGFIAALDEDMHNAALPTCTTELDGHWRGTAAGDWFCVGAFGRWARYNPIGVSLYFTGNEPGTFKGPAEGRRFFIQTPAAVGEPLRCFSITATVNSVGTCVGACAALPVGQQIARLAFGQDIAGNLCYADVPCTAALESVVSSSGSACGVDAGTTGVRSFFWIEPTASNCSESPVLSGSIVCNVTDS